MMLYFKHLKLWMISTIGVAFNIAIYNKYKLQY